jgi:AraC-like DNA-binding protein
MVGARWLSGGSVVVAAGNSEETLSVRAVRALVDAVERLGVSRTRLLAAGDWDPKQLEVVEGRIASSKFHRLCDLAIELTGDQALGLHVVKLLRPDSVDLVGQLVVHASNPRQAVESLIRLHKLMADRCHQQLIETDRHVTIRYMCPEGLSERARRFFAELHVTGAYRMFRYFAPKGRPTEVSFEHEAPAYRAEYARIFKGAERFGQSFTGITFERGLMDAARRYRDEEYHRTLCVLADSRVSRLGRGASCADAVREVIARHDPRSKMGMAEVARALGVSTRSLRRRLSAEGTSFEAVVSDALATMARHLLVVQQRTIQETAYDLGYSDTTAFHRAFKRWTGTTPSAWQAGKKVS